MYSMKIGNEVYVYRNGHLIYKKWLDRNQSVVFNNLPVWKTECANTDINNIERD